MAKVAICLFKGLLLSATILSAAPAVAQDAPPAGAQDNDDDERLDQLEAMVSALIERMDAKEGAPNEGDVAAAQEAQRAISETRALAQRTKAVETKIAAQSSEGKGFNIGDTRVTYGGYVKVDAISQRTSGGQVETGSIVRDFLIPGAIPIGGTASGFDTDFSARQSRFILETSTNVGDGHTLGSKIELDFMVTPDGNERISNSYLPRLRHAYLTFDNWLFGQAWSTFQDVGALPDALDFVGPTPGTVFGRQPMIRYTRGGLQLAVEQPETTLTSPTGARVVPGDDNLPDIVLRYNLKGDF